MGKLIVTEFVTLDGVAQAPGGPDEDRDGVTSIKERHDEVHVIGRLNLVQSLLRLGLVDRLNLWLYPLVLGSGKQLFADGTVPTSLRLTESITYRNGTLQLAYETAGALTYGNLAGEEEDLQRFAGDD